MNNAKRGFQGILILLLALGAAAVAGAAGLDREISFGATAVRGANAPTGLWARAGVGLFNRSTGLQLDLFVSDPNSSFIEGSVVFNPFRRSPVSPILRAGGALSLNRLMSLDLAAGFRVRIRHEFGLRLEYHFWDPFSVKSLRSISVGAVWGW
jgi:hypothetical protein